MTKYLLGYDIANEKRLQRIYRRMIKYATPIQYSLFILDGNEVALNKCLTDVMSIFNKKEDDLRVYMLPSNFNQEQLGKSPLPIGIFWFGI